MICRSDANNSQEELVKRRQPGQDELPDCRGSTMGRLRRFLLIVLAILVVAVLVLEVGRRYLLGRRVGAAVAARLQAAYGAPVRVGDVDVGLGSSAVHELNLFEQDSPDEEPWAVIQEVRTDVSI